MTTPSIEELISAYIDGELDSKTAAEVRSEIVSSLHLQELERSLRELSGQLRNLPALRPNGGLSRSILSKLEQKAIPAIWPGKQAARRSGNHRGRAWLKIWAATITTAAAVLLAVLFWDPGEFARKWSLAANEGPAPASERTANQPERAVAGDAPASASIDIGKAGKGAQEPAPGSSSYKVADQPREIVVAETDTEQMLQASKKVSDTAKSGAPGIDPTQAPQGGFQNDRNDQVADNLKNLEALGDKEKSMTSGKFDERDKDPAKFEVPRPSAPPGNVAKGDDRLGLADAAMSRSAENRDSNREMPQVPQGLRLGGGAAPSQSGLANAGSGGSQGDSGFGMPGPVIAGVDGAASIGPQVFSVQVPSHGRSWQSVAESISGSKVNVQPLPGNESVRDVFLFEGTSPEWDSLISRIVSAEKDVAISVVDLPVQEAQLSDLSNAVGESKLSLLKSGIDFRQQANPAMEFRPESDQVLGDAGFELYYLGRIGELEKDQSGREGVGGREGQSAGELAGNRGRGLGEQAGAGGGAGGGAGVDKQNVGQRIPEAAQTDRKLNAEISGQKREEQAQNELFKDTDPENWEVKNAVPVFRRYLVLSVAPKQVEAMPADHGK